MISDIPEFVFLVLPTGRCVPISPKWYVAFVLSQGFIIGFLIGALLVMVL
jgi:hypothetical protein